MSLKKILVPNCETVASNKLLKLVKLGLAVSKYAKAAILPRPAKTIITPTPFVYISASFFSTLNNAHSQQQQQQNGTTSESSTFSSGASQVIKLEPGERDPNAFNFPFTTYPRPWAQASSLIGTFFFIDIFTRLGSKIMVINRSTINLDRDIHELPNGGSPTKLFECSLCGKVFNRRDKVKRHLSELHHGIKSYQCATCARAFSRNDKLVRHIMTVHQGGAWYISILRFLSATARHCNDSHPLLCLRILLGIKAFGCSHCSRRFSRRWEYQRHMQVIHPNLLTLGKDVSKVSPVATPHVSAAHQVVGSQTNTASGTTEAETCSTQAPCNSTASEQCTNSSDPPVTRPIVPSAVSNGVTTRWESNHGASVCLLLLGSLPICPTVSTLSTRSTSTSCPTQSLTFAPSKCSSPSSSPTTRLPVYSLQVLFDDGGVKVHSVFTS
ncbi:unnamed protein product [Schistocephalus solidus]|uniref:C2H2-type domain-containing protein n=1 Tax=Schistocephalus solidus TaxID=70667 RepID=A0A3P7DUU4_SCHSO|nr:unnamed protein product [Schistocephalus solidus]